VRHEVAATTRRASSSAMALGCHPWWAPGSCLQAAPPNRSVCGADSAQAGESASVLRLPAWSGDGQPGRRGVQGDRAARGVSAQQCPAANSIDERGDFAVQVDRAGREALASADPVVDDGGDTAIRQQLGLRPVESLLSTARTGGTGWPEAGTGWARNR
jgi:hypothetical protein